MVSYQHYSSSITPPALLLQHYSSSIREAGARVQKHPSRLLKTPHQNRHCGDRKPSGPNRLLRMHLSLAPDLCCQSSCQWFVILHSWCEYIRIGVPGLRGHLSLSINSSTGATERMSPGHLLITTWCLCISWSFFVPLYFHIQTYHLTVVMVWTNRRREYADMISRSCQLIVSYVIRGQ